MKKIILNILSFLSRQLILKHKPFVIGVTGTVGKTTVTNFVYEFLKSVYKDEAYKSEYDYNGEFGLPMTILKSKSPNKNIFLWIILFLRFVFLYFTKNYPKYIVLEYGIDRPGEMEFLTKIVKPDIGIILNISPNHITQFPDYNDYISEKILLGKVSKSVIYNSDDKVLEEHFSKLENSHSFGIENLKADYIGSEIESDLDGLSFKLTSSKVTANLKFKLIGTHQVYNILPIFVLSDLLNIDFDTTYESLLNINAQKGRGTLLRGVKDSIIIDGSYNGGFLAISSGVKYLDELNAASYKKILFIGDMRELGPESRKTHSDLVDLIIQTNIDNIFLVGEEMGKYAYERLKEKFSEGRVFWSKNSIVAGDKIRKLINKTENKCVIYVKGSQNTIFLEEGIKKFLFDVKDVSKLCRQSDHWLAIKDSFFSHIL